MNPARTSRPLNSDFNSFIASVTDRRPTSGSSTAGPTTSSTPSASLKTFVSVSEGQTLTVSVTPEPEPTSQSTADTSLGGERASGNGAPVGAIAGGTIGGVVLLASILFLLLFSRRKRRMNEQRQATLPPTYPGGDMSEQLAGTTTPTTTTVHSETKVVTASNNKVSPDLVQQLDSAAVFPMNEADVDPLGNIAELPATERASDPFVTPDQSPVTPIRESKDRLSRGSDDHVMSWAQYNSMGTRNASSRLSQPHMAPDAAGGLWENMSPTKTKGESFPDLDQSGKDL